MKKTVFALLALFAGALAAVSCVSQGFEGPEHEISLEPVSGVATKASSAGPITNTTFPTGRTILLSAYYTDTNDYNDPNVLGHSQAYFTNIPFTYYSSKWAGGTSVTPNPKYWPHQGTMNFIALSKEGLDGTVTTTTASQIIYVMPDNSTNQDDVMMAYVGPQNCATHAAVPLSFKHAQAQVCVTAKLAAAAYSPNYGITIRSITLRKARYSGRVTGAASGTNSISYTWANVASGTQANVAFGSSNLALTTTAQAYGKGIVLPVQSPTGQAANIDILIEYTLKNGLNASSAAEEKNLSYVYTVPATTWAAGNKYTYAFTFSWNEITCSPTVTEWSAQNATNVTL